MFTNFYITAFTFYPLFLLLTVPLGLGLSALLWRNEPDEIETEIALVLAPLAGLAIVITLIGWAVRVGVPLPGLVLLLVAVNTAAGWWYWRAGRRALSLWRPAAPLLVGFFCYLVLIAPLLVAGDYAVLGYNTNNDPVFHTIIPEYIARYGYRFPAEFLSGFTQAAIDKLKQQGYPDGWHLTLLPAQAIYGLRAYHLFNMAVAFFASLTALVGYAWGRQVGLGRRWALAGGAAAAVGYLQLSYAFQGYAPQVAVVPFLYGALLALYKAITERRREYFPIAVLFIQAGLAVYSFTILLWLGVYLAALVAVRLIGWEYGRWGGDILAAEGVLLAGLLVNPFVLTRLYTSLQAVRNFADSDGLGNLISAAVPILPVFYIWPVGDHRLLPAGSLNHLIYIPALIVFALMVWGMLCGPRRRFWAAAAAAVVVPMIAVKVAGGPYYFAKTLQMAAPFVGLAATAGIFRLSLVHKRVAAAAAGALVTAALVSNVALVRTISMTPQDRFNELLEINETFGSGPDRALFLSRGEDWGPYLLSNFETASPLARTYQGAAPGVRGAVEVADGIRTANDLDDFSGVLSTRFDWLIIDRAIDGSLPPPPFEWQHSGRFYTVYKRVGPVSAAARHIPAEDATDPASPPYLQLAPGESVSIPIDTAFEVVQVSAYLFPDIHIAPATALTTTKLSGSGLYVGKVLLADLKSQPDDKVVFSVGKRSVTARIGRLPAVYVFSLASDTKVSLGVKNISAFPLRLDWVEPHRKTYDQEALFRYNRNNKLAFQSIERLIRR